MSIDAEETESKHRVIDLDGLLAALAAAGHRAGPAVAHVDEYYDTRARRLHRDDFVVRLRLVDGRVTAGFKGPRTHAIDGTYRRIEVEFPAGDPAEVRAALAAQGLIRTWRLEKRRREFRLDQRLVAALDEVPALGWYLELEGDPDRIGRAAARFGPAIGPPEPRNYHELLLAWWRGIGRDPDTCTGLTFDGS